MTDAEKNKDKAHRATRMLRPRSKPPTDAYRDGWEKVFGKKSRAVKAERAFERKLAKILGG